MIRVKLLDVCTNPEKLLFAAGRQCYAKDWVGDLWKNDGGEISILNMDNNKSVSDKEIKSLIKYLYESGHTSVLEHVKFTFAIDGVSRAETHQQVRHRISTYSQQSQRYVTNYGEYNPADYVVPPTIEKNAEAASVFDSTLRTIQESYNKLKDLGISSEDARYLMPNASISRIVDTKNCVSLLHFFGLRCCVLAQWEIRDLANKMLDICKKTLPSVFDNAGPRCSSLGYCPEHKSRSCGKYPTKQEVLDVYNDWAKTDQQH